MSVVTFDSLRPSKRSLFACFDRRCVWEADFEQFFAFLANFGGPSGNPFGTDCDKKQDLKKEYKNGRFFGGVTGHCWARRGTVGHCWARWRSAAGRPGNCFTIEQPKAGVPPRQLVMESVQQFLMFWAEKTVQKLFKNC